MSIQSSDVSNEEYRERWKEHIKETAAIGWNLPNEQKGELTETIDELVDLLDEAVEHREDPTES